MTTATSATYGDLLRRTIDLMGTLAVHCRLADPDLSREWGRLSLDMLERLKDFAQGVPPHQLALPVNQIGKPERVFLILALLNMELLGVLAGREQVEKPVQSALPPHQAKAIAELLTHLGVFVGGVYSATNRGAPIPEVERLAAHLSVYMGPLAEAFALAMVGDQVAAREAQRIAEGFLVDFESGAMLPLFEQNEGGAV